MIPPVESVETIAGKQPWYRKPRCLPGTCQSRTNSDETGVWYECTSCGKRRGFVARATLRAFADAEANHRSVYVRASHAG